MEALFARMWICAGRTEQVERPGQFFLREVLGESVIVTRAASGAVSAFYNVCRHRGTRLCTEDAGAVRRQHPVPVSRVDLRSRRTPVGAPHMDEVPHFRKEDYRAPHGRTPTCGTATSS